MPWFKPRRRSYHCRLRYSKTLTRCFYLGGYLDINTASLIFVYNYIDMAYNDNKEHKRIIDCVLHQNAQLFQNLGTDSSKSEYDKAKVNERQKLRRIRDIDPEKLDRLIKESLDD